MRIDLYAIGLVNLLAISCALAAPLPVIYSTHLTKRIGGPAVEGAVAKSKVFRKIGQAFKSGMKRLRPKTKFKPTAGQFGAENRVNIGQSPSVGGTSVVRSDRLPGSPSVHVGEAPVVPSHKWKPGEVSRDTRPAKKITLDSDGPYVIRGKQPPVTQQTSSTFGDYGDGEYALNHI
ncbi:hypothetical protein FRB94_004320 [Tulasnella sp. JGI-2019a]|nr:hypothetical protein FRB94_004320 [Tulasnella sp. JGI-2019a]KAG9039270.1 hypothetical protein FRB95_011855 [Tulasnella sp. JGI-2019a]